MYVMSVTPILFKKTTTKNKTKKKKNNCCKDMKKNGLSLIQPYLDTNTVSETELYNL